MAISNEELELEYKIVNPQDYLAMARIKGSALHVYCAHLAKENLDRDSHPSIDWIMTATGLCRKTVYKGRRYLVQKGYLTKVGEVAPRNHDGRYPVPVMRSNSIPSQNLLCVEKKVPHSPIVKSSTIDCNAFDFAFASGFAVAVGGDSGHSNTTARTTTTAVPPSAASETLEEHKSVKSKSKSPLVQENGISGKRKSRVAGDGTPWTEEVYKMTPTVRLAWMIEHDGKPKLGDLDKVEEPEVVEPKPKTKLNLMDRPPVYLGEYCSRCGIDHFDGKHRFSDGYGYDVGCRLDLSKDTIKHCEKFHPHRPCAVCGKLFVTRNYELTRYVKDYHYDGDTCSICQGEGSSVAGKEVVLNDK